jgi:nucleotide-binding universal stress UspA family protein
MYKRILVPLEDDRSAGAHVQHASALASSLGAELILLRVIAVVPSDEYFMRRIQIEEGSRGAREKTAAEDHLARLGKQLRDQGISAHPAVVVSDEPEDQAIVKYALASDCDLVVLPNQRRSLISRWLKGNVAARVQRRSPIPVLFVRSGG